MSDNKKKDKEKKNKKNKKVSITQMNLEDYVQENSGDVVENAAFEVWYVKRGRSPLERFPIDKWNKLFKKCQNSPVS